jgi:hypothetical protein
VSDFPEVTDLDATDDGDWFGANPQRAYRLRQGADGWWIIEKRPGGELLRRLGTARPTRRAIDDDVNRKRRAPKRLFRPS